MFEEGKKIVAEPDASRLLTERELTDVMKECWKNTIPLGKTALEKYANLSKALAFEVAQAQDKKTIEIEEPKIRQDEREKIVEEIEQALDRAPVHRLLATLENTLQALKKGQQLKKEE